jgi:phosphoribosylformylglycinamidine synthase subunit PurSL
LEFILPDIRDKEVSTIEVGPFIENGTAHEINRFLGTHIKELYRVKTYILVHSKGLNLESLLHSKPFVDPIIHRATLNSPLITELNFPFDFVLQSMLNPGTSDAEGDTALHQALLSLGAKYDTGDQGFFSNQYFLNGKLTSEELEAVSAFLANPDLYVRQILGHNEYQQGKKIAVPIVTLKHEIRVDSFDVANMTIEELLHLNSTRKLAASSEELIQFRELYKEPGFIEQRKKYGLDSKATDVELETWFGLRSEHCFHKEFNARITLEDRAHDPIFQMAFERGYLKKDESGNYVIEDGIFKTFIEKPARLIYDRLSKRGNNWIASMFEDNSGVVYYDENFMFCIKFETHNSPSNKEPVQGAKTGIDGVNRDIFGTMRGTFDAISNFFFYCTGDPQYKGFLPTSVKHPYTILKGITQGVREGGNESQIPTLGGGLITDPRYIAKCLVYCGTVGWSPVKSRLGKSYITKDPWPGDWVFVAGQPVGIDGVHGATESSLSASAYISLGHVQADFSFIQAKMKEFLLQISRDNLLSDITDMGAMGLGSASHEAAKATGGLDLDLAMHPVKYQGLQPWQINCSETQDRMLLVSNPHNKAKILETAKLHEVEVTQLGKLTSSGFVHLLYQGKTVALLDIKKLFNKEPRKYMHATWDNIRPDELLSRGKYTLEESLCLVMSQADVASKEWFFRQKDSSVKGATIQGPLIGLEQIIDADATVQKPLETNGKDYGAIAYAQGIAPKLSDFDAYYASQKSFIDMVGKIIAIGGALPDMNNPKWDAWACCGNYCQPNSDSTTTLTKDSGEHNLASLIREAIAIREVTEALNIPVISGKDSMKCSCVYEVASDFNADDVPADLREHINLCEKEGKKFIEIFDPATYLASCAVKISDYRKLVSSAFKKENDIIYAVGKTRNNMAASQYALAVGYKEYGKPLRSRANSEINIAEFLNTAQAIHSAIDNEIIASCSYVHNGGILAAITKASMAGMKGARIITDKIESQNLQRTDENLLYSETCGRFIVTVAPGDREKFEECMRDIFYSRIGTVAAKDFNILMLDNSQAKIDLAKVKEHYQKTLRFG